MRQDGKKTRKPGQFQEQRAILQARQARHDRILRASKEAGKNGSAWLTLDGQRLRVTLDEDKAISGGPYHFLAIVRTKSFGMQLADVHTKDRGYVTLVGGDFPTIGLSKNLVVLYVNRVEDKDGHQIPWWEGRAKSQPIEDPNPLLDFESP